MSKLIEEWPCRNCKDRKCYILDYHCKKHDLKYPFVVECNEEGPRVLIYEEKGNRIVPIICKPEEYKEGFVPVLKKERNAICPECNSESYYLETKAGGGGGIFQICDECNHKELLLEF